MYPPKIKIYSSYAIIFDPDLAVGAIPLGFNLSH